MSCWRWNARRDVYKKRPARAGSALRSTKRLHQFEGLDERSQPGRGGGLNDFVVLPGKNNIADFAARSNHTDRLAVEHKTDSARITGSDPPPFMPCETL